MEHIIAQCKKEEKVVAIVLAAGSGTRMQTNIAKQFLLLDQKPMLYYSLLAFQKSQVDEIIIVTSKPYMDQCKEIVENYHFSKVKKICLGGKERYHSVYQGLLEIENCDYVLIHDGARPCISVDTINKTIQMVVCKKACIVAVPSKDTVKLVDEDGKVKKTPDRKCVWNVQTPQAFSYSLVRNAYEECMKQNCSDITDDAMVVETITKQSIYVLQGDYTNIKVTTPEDMVLAKAFLGIISDKIENC